jgi:hypothetical protein
VLDKRLQFSFWLQVKNLLIPNLVFFSFLTFSLLFKNYVNQWGITILFLITHVIYIKLIKHESYTFMQAALKKGITILKKKF